MPVEVIMPMLGMAQETGKVVRWLKAEGEAVAKAEPLMEVETDKVTVEIEAPAEGTLAGVTASEGEDIPVGQVIAYVLGDGEQLPEPDARNAPPAAAVAEPAVSRGQTAGHGGNGQAARRTLASPRARRLAREHGVPIEEITGSGPYGAVQAVDVEALARPRTLAVPPERSSAWQTMARRMSEIWREVPHFYLSREVEATRLNGWRDAVRRRPGHE